MFFFSRYAVQAMLCNVSPPLQKFSSFNVAWEVTQCHHTGPISDQDPWFVKSTHPSNAKQFSTRFYVQTLPQKYFAEIAQAASTAYMLLLDATHFTISLGTTRSVISIAFQVFTCFPVCLRKKHRASDVGDRDITPKSKQSAYEQVSQ